MNHFGKYYKGKCIILSEIYVVLMFTTTVTFFSWIGWSIYSNKSANYSVLSDELSFAKVKRLNTVTIFSSLLTHRLAEQQHLGELGLEEKKVIAVADT